MSMQHNNPKLNLQHRRLYQVIKAPVITEKSTQAGTMNAYTFRVDTASTKADNDCAN